MKTKTCNTCHLPKPLTAFRKNIRYADGRVGKCIDYEKEREAELKEQRVVGEEYFDDKKGAF